jgi:hypothetical protein
MAMRVILAIYGALNDGDADKTEAVIVTDALQAAIDASPNVNGVVRIDNDTMGVPAPNDPAHGERKHFAAIVEVDGVERPFAAGEGQTIDFS